VTGPGAALWVEATPIEDPPATGRALELAKEYKALVVGVLQQRGAWQVIDSVQQTTDPGALADLAGWASWLDTEHKAQLLAEIDVVKRLELLLEWTRGYIAEQEISRRSPVTCARAWRRPSASSCCASSWPRSARSWARTSPTAPTTTAPGSSPPTCPSTSARPR
jgi:hypothetical protein